MANIKSAKKRIKVIDKKTARNRRVKDHVKEALRAFDDAMAEGYIRLLYHDSPRHPRQKYLLTEKGNALLEKLRK